MRWAGAIVAVAGACVALVLAGAFRDVEWGGDGVTALGLLIAAVGLVAIGHLVGRWRLLGWSAGLVIAPAAILDALYEFRGVNPGGMYCDPAVCDPGPLPMLLFALSLPAVWALLAVGIVLRRRHIPDAVELPRRVADSDPAAWTS